MIDASALDWDRILCSAGRRGLEIELAPTDLAQLSGAVTAQITAAEYPVATVSPCDHT